MGGGNNGAEAPITQEAPDAQPDAIAPSGPTKPELAERLDDVPRIFISHRHADREIADILRSFFLEATAGRVKVFQSSFVGSAPEIGKILTEELGQELYHAELVFLICTVADENWSYCMWECGVAFNPRKDDTRIVVLQCGQDVPAPLNDRVRVALNDETSIKVFVKQFLTDENFFPRLRRPITDFEQESQNVTAWAERLHTQLQAVVTYEPDDAWHAWPYLLLELPLSAVEEIQLAYDDSQEEAVHALLRQHCVVAANAENVPQLFGKARLSYGHSLHDLISTWQRKQREADSIWVKSLLDQLTAATCGDFPSPDWAALRHAQNQNLHAPMLLKVFRSPSKRCMQFDVYFPWFKVDEASGGPAVMLPA